jgi:flagellar biosynthesis chaperone FliJ
MKAERAKLARLQRLEKLRAIAKQNAVTEAARAENTLSQLTTLADRTRSLTEEYAARRDMTDGADLARMQRFIMGLQGIAATTDADRQRAHALADRRQAELVAAERRRAAVEERAQEQARFIAAKIRNASFSGQSAGRVPSGDDSGTDHA